MDFKALKEEVEKNTYKKEVPNNISVMEGNYFAIISALYYSEISCNHVTSVGDIYNIVNISGIDKKLFEFPFYIKISLHYLDENIINIINQLDKAIYVQIEVFLDVDVQIVEFLTKIKHEKCQLNFQRITCKAAELLIGNFALDSEANPILVIDEIDYNTLKLINFFESFFEHSYFTFEIKDISSLQNIYAILPYIPQDEIQINIDDNIFNEKNPNNARNLLVQEQIGQKPQDKKLRIMYNGLQYDDLETIFELEKRLEIIISHIPFNARGLDIVTYISLFIANYFKYDDDLYENIINGKNDGNFDDNNLAKLVSLGKGVCNHFASFTKYLLNLLGVECEVVISYKDYKTKEIGHAFNIVKLNGKWYFLDNTWLLEEIQKKEIQSLAESEEFLRSNDDFDHKEYADVLNNYKCETYDREEIKASVGRVLSWNKVFVIRLGALNDLFRKKMIKKGKSIENKIIDAIPKRH